MNETRELEIPELHLREWELQGPTADVLGQISQEMPEEDFVLFRETAILAEETGVDDETRARALTLLADFYQAGPEDAQFARGSMQALPIMLRTADALEDATGIMINRKLVWLGVLHDIGKEFVQEETKHKSNIGAENYNAEDTGNMEGHIIYGAIKVILGGVPQAAPLPAKHHERQPFNPYSVDIDTTPEEDLAIICVAIGDHLGAAKTRNNNRTTGMRRSAIWRRARDAVDYTLKGHPDLQTNSDELTERVMEAGWSRTELQEELFSRLRSKSGAGSVAKMAVLN